MGYYSEDSKTNINHKSVLTITPSFLIGVSEFAFLIRSSVVNSLILASSSLFIYICAAMNALIIIPLILYAICTYNKAIKIDAIFLIVFNCLLFWVTLQLNPTYSSFYFDSHTSNGGGMDIYTKIFNLFSSAFMGYLLVRADENNDHFYYVLVLSCRVKFLLSFWQFRMQEDYMSFGYEMALIAVVLLASYFTQKKKLDLLLSVVSIIEGVIFGSRGCILGYLTFYIFASFVIEKKAITWKKTVIIAGGFLTYILMSSNAFIAWLVTKLDSANLSSRSLQIFIAGDYTKDSARSNIWHECIQAIKNHSIFYGYGAYGDRYVLWNGRYYAHNIVLEVILTFGLLFGIIAIGIFVYYLLHAYRKGEFLDKVFISACACFALCRLFISSSFWYEKILFILIALCVNKVKEIKLE